MQITKLKDIDFDELWQSLSEDRTIYMPIDFGTSVRKVMLKTTTAVRADGHLEPPIVETMTDDYAVWDVIPYDRPAMLLGIRTPRHSITSALLEFCLGPPTFQDEDLTELNPISIVPPFRMGIIYMLHHIRTRYCESMEYNVTPTEEHGPFLRFCRHNRRVWRRYRDDIPEDVQRAIISA